eukprot:jgi/Astpho2/7326/Aster-01627
MTGGQSYASATAANVKDNDQGAQPAQLDAPSAGGTGGLSGGLPGGTQGKDGNEREAATGAATGRGAATNTVTAGTKTEAGEGQGLSGQGGVF